VTLGNPRRVLISANWKMHQDHVEALKLVRELAAALRSAPLPEGREVSLHPPFTSLRTVQAAIEDDHLPVSLGAQTCHFADRGPYTGEISAEMLAKLNVAYVIAGHSERRAQCGETNEVVRCQLDAIYRHGMAPILCVGETTEERRDGAAVEKMRRQVAAALGGRPAEAVASTVIAYEPIWAIGAGHAATPADAEEMCSAIRDEVDRLVGAGAAGATRIIYGGSVTPETAEALLANRDVDGFLVGGASLDADAFAAIVCAGVRSLATSPPAPSQVRI